MNKSKSEKMLKEQLASEKLAIILTHTNNYTDSELFWKHLTQYRPTTLIGMIHVIAIYHMYIYIYIYIYVCVCACPIFVGKIQKTHTYIYINDYTYIFPCNLTMAKIGSSARRHSGRSLT